MLSGFPGGPGVATTYFLDTDTALASLHDFWEAMALGMPSAVTIVQDPAGDVIEDTTGEITGSWGADPVGAITGASASVYAAPVGIVVEWLTSTILDGRRLRGKTFIVPMSSSVLDTSGSIADTALVGLRAAALNFSIEQSASFVIWHRPKFGPKPVGGGARPLLQAGGHGLVTSTRVPDKSAVLRSRRD